MGDLHERTLQILRDRLGWLAEQVRANHEAAGQVASGKLYKSIVANIEDQGSIIHGDVSALDYVETTEKGSAPWPDIPTKQASDGHVYEYVPQWFADAIGQWMRDKGLQENKQFNRYSVAWSIIHNGTLLYQDGGRSDIYSEVTQAVVDEIATAISAEVAVEINTLTLNLEK